jgi:hypothetical protein
MLTGLKMANLGARFVLELCALAAMSYWGARTGQGPLMKIGLGVGAPLLGAVAWGLLASPRALVKLSFPAWLGFEAVFFGLAVAGLAAAGRPALAWALGVALVLNAALLAIWGQGY